MLPIVTPNGAHITLGAVADIVIISGPAGIKSENARLNGWTYIDIADVDVGTYVADAQAYLVENLSLPTGYALNWAGQYEYMQRAEAKLTYVLPLTLAIIVILLYLSFRSVAEVAMILVTLPMAMIGGLWLLYLEGFNFSIAVGVGFIALAGVAVEIGVLMLVYLNQAMRDLQDQAKSAQNPIQPQAFTHALVEGAARRVRPVMMTVATIILGLLPILYGTGTGSEVMSRIAAPMVGGMLSAVVLTLLVLPAIYALVKQYEIKRFNQQF